MYVDLLIGFIKIYFLVIGIMYYGLVETVLLFIFLTISYFYFMKYVFGLEKLTSSDKVFIAERKNERINIICLMLFDNFDAQKMELSLLEGIRQIKKMRQRLVYKFADFYWKEEEFEKCINNVIRLQESFPDFDQIHKLAESELNQHINVLKEFPYKYIIFNIKDNKGGVIMKFDHVLSDGLGMMNLLVAMSDFQGNEAFPPILAKFKTSIWQLLLEILLFPYYGPKVLLTGLLLKGEKTPMKINGPTSGDGLVAFSKSYNFEQLSKINKKMQISFNDLMVSVINHSVIKYADINKLENNNFSKFVAMFPVGYKKLPKNIDDLNLKNEARGVIMEFPACKDLKKDSLKISKTLQSCLKNSCQAKALVWIGLVMNEFLPYKTIHYFINLSVKVMDFVISNVPGPDVELTYNQNVLTDVIPVCSSGKSSNFIIFLTYNKKLRLSVTFDRKLKIDPWAIMKIIENQLDELIDEYCK